MIKLNKIGALTSKPYAFNARPWELKNVNTIDIFDSFGSSIRLDFRDKEILRVLPRKSEWISDKVRFFYDSLKYQRFHNFYIKKNSNLIKTNFYQILFFFKIVVQYMTTISFLFKFGHLTDLESIFSVKSLIYSLLKKGKISLVENENKSYFDSNLQNYYFNIENLNNTDLILLVDLNLRFENPILNSIIRKHVLKHSELKIFALGSILNYNVYIKHISNNTDVLKSIIEGKHKFNLVFNKAVKPLILFGDSFFKRQYSFIFFSWMEKLKQLNNKVICLHLVNNIAKLGYNELGTINNNFNAYNKDLTINFNIGGISKYNKCNKNSVLIYQSSNYNDIALTSDIILPEASFTEKESLFFTLNSGLSATKKVYNPSKEARDGFIFLQCFLFLIYKLPLSEEAFLIKGLNNLQIKNLKETLQVRLLKRSLFNKNNQKCMKITEPIFNSLFIKSIVSNIVNLYYATDILSKSSFNLNARSKIEESTFLNFEYKNVIN